MVMRIAPARMGVSLCISQETSTMLTDDGDERRDAKVGDTIERARDREDQANDRGDTCPEHGAGSAIRD